MNFVFVPGLWHGGWAWHPVGQRVRAAGHHAHALTLPGLAMGDDPTGLRLDDAVNHIVTEAETRDLRNVVLVGHSFAGIPITGAAHRLSERLAHIVFFSACAASRNQGCSTHRPLCVCRAACAPGAVDRFDPYTVPVEVCTTPSPVHIVQVEHGAAAAGEYCSSRWRRSDDGC